MQLEDLVRPNLVTFLGLGVAAVVLPELVPSLRPALKSAIKIGIDLLVESQGEAEAELMHSLVASTLKVIDEELSKPADEEHRREAVNRHIRSFQHKARSRAVRWNPDEHRRHRAYRKHVAQLQAGLVERKQEVGLRRRKIIDDASTFLAQEIG